MIKAILFDFDDTLVKTKEIRYEALKEAGKKFYNLNISNSDIDKYWGTPFNIMISGVFKNSDKPDVLTANYKSILGKYPNIPIEYTNEVINLLSKKYTLGIISSSNRSLILSGLENVGLSSDIFFFIQSSEDTTVHKPNPKVFNPIMEKLIKKHIGVLEVIYIGDALDDYYAAVNAGFNFCGLANRTVQEDVFVNNKIPYLNDIRDLPYFIKNIQFTDLNRNLNPSS